MSILSQVSCTPCRPGEPPITDEEVAVLHPLVPTWRIVDESGVRKLRNEFEFDDTGASLEFVRRLEEIASKEDHHPKAEVHGKKVTVAIWTHVIHGLHPNDFILAAKADGAFTEVMVGAEGTMYVNESLPRLGDLPRFQHMMQRRIARRRDDDPEASRRVSLAGRNRIGRRSVDSHEKAQNTQKRELI